MNRTVLILLVGFNDRFQTNYAGGAGGRAVAPHPRWCQKQTKKQGMTIVKNEDGDDETMATILIMTTDIQGKWFSLEIKEI